jgi:hypothetical protein
MMELWCISKVARKLIWVGHPCSRTLYMITNEILRKPRRLQPQVKDEQNNVLSDPEKVE